MKSLDSSGILKQKKTDYEEVYPFNICACSVYFLMHTDRKGRGAPDGMAWTDD